MATTGMTGCFDAHCDPDWPSPTPSGPHTHTHSPIRGGVGQPDPIRARVHAPGL